MKRQRPPTQDLAIQTTNGIASIGAFVRARRRARQLTQSDLAALSGVTRALVIDIEHGKPTLRIDGVERVLNVFGKTLGAVDIRADHADPAS